MIDASGNITGQTAGKIKDPAKLKKLRDAADQFESIFVGMMMKSMRGTVGSGDGEDDGDNSSCGVPKTSMGEGMYTSMLDEQYSKIMSSSAGFGLSDQIVKQVAAQENLDISDLKSISKSKTMPIGLDMLKSWSPISSKGNVSEYNAHIMDASKTYGVDPSLIKAVIMRESAGKSNAVSTAGAKGLMQLMDSTASDMGVQKVFDPKENIMGGTKYLSQLLNRFNGDESLALASYNAGPAAVERSGGIPPYRETRDYVRNVLATKEALQSTAASNK